MRQSVEGREMWARKYRIYGRNVLERCGAGRSGSSRWQGWRAAWRAGSSKSRKGGRTGRSTHTK